MALTLTRAWITIERAHPDSKDASVSTIGHEAQIRSKRLTSEEQIAEFMTANGPEFLSPEARTLTIDDDPEREKIILTARDPRGYYGQAYIQRWRSEAPAE